MTTPRPMADRFWPKVDRRGPDECWPWTGGQNGYGYGYFNVDVTRTGHRNAAAHRVAYELSVGPIPDGLTLDHLCLNRLCVNPAHLEPVTLAENIRRSPQAKAKLARTHCPQGHEYTPENIRWRQRPNPGRSCRACDSGSSRGRRVARVALASRLDLAVTNHRPDLVPMVAARLRRLGESYRDCAKPVGEPA